MTQATPFGRDVFARHISTDGNSFVEQHRVWDADRFFAARKADAQKLNSEVKGNQPRLARVEQITQEQYHASR